MNNKSVNAKRQRPAGSTKFEELAKSNSSLPLDTPPTFTPDDDIDDVDDDYDDTWYGQKFTGTIDADTVRRYTLDDCYLLATELAEQNNWGMVVVASASQEDDEDYWDVDNLVHAYAQRPDGMLMDVNGPTPMETATNLAAQWEQHGVKVFTFFTAADAHAVFDKDNWGEPDDYDYAAVVAQMVTDLHD